MFKFILNLWESILSLLGIKKEDINNDENIVPDNDEPISTDPAYIDVEQLFTVLKQNFPE